jgi:phosphate/phosphite/phosphonate ABC transporter binding protein
MNRLLLFILCIFCFSCNNPISNKSVVDFSEKEANSNDTISHKTKPVFIAIASMTSPKETITYYNDLINYISKKVGHPIYIKQKKTYAEVNELLETGAVDFAFICSGAYVDIIRKRKIKLLAVPKVDGELFYHALIIAHKDKGINEFSDFKDHSFAFTDPLSNTGRLFPQSQLLEINAIEEEFFSKTIYSYGHDISIQMVNRGIIDGASVHGLIFEYLNIHHPEKVENIKIIGRSRKQKVVLTDDFVIEEIPVDGKLYQYQQVEASFTQPNALVNQKMLTWASDCLKDSNNDLVELYCGNGNFTAVLAQHFDKVLATEISKVSVNSANYNFDLNKVDNVTIARLSSEEFTQALNRERAFRRLANVDLDSFNFSTIFVDPPRAGLDSGTEKLVTEMDSILYISCNPETLAENLKQITKTHQVVSAALFDQFPWTKHIESGVLLKRR